MAIGLQIDNKGHKIGLDLRLSIFIDSKMSIHLLKKILPVFGQYWNFPGRFPFCLSSILALRLILFTGLHVFLVCSCRLPSQLATIIVNCNTEVHMLFQCQRDTTGLTAENTELKLRLQAMEQQAQLRDGISDKLVIYLWAVNLNFKLMHFVVNLNGQFQTCHSVLSFFHWRVDIFCVETSSE